MMYVAGAVSKDDGYVITKRRQKQLRKTTVGWQLLVRWKDQSESWVPSKDMKESHPAVDVVESAKSRGIHDTLKKRDVIIMSIKTRVRKTTNKYGIEVPMNLENGHRIDQKNVNTFWCDATKLEMTNVGMAFEVLEDGVSAPSGWH